MDRLAAMVGGEPSVISELVVRLGVGFVTSLPPKLEKISRQAANPNSNKCEVGKTIGDLLVVVLDIRTDSP